VTVAARHRWNSWEQYQAIHEKKIAGYSPHFVVEDRLTPILTPAAVIWEGVLYCADGLEIQVTKVQDLRRRGDGRPEVQTRAYAYHVLQRLPTGERNLFRYDNAHAYEGHPDAHHRHEYDADGSARVEHLTARGWRDGDWPTLGDVLDELHELWRSRLAAPW
jgi:hypothetical protein